LAVKSEISADLTLEIDGSAVSPDKFLRSVRAFFAIVTEVSSKVAGKKSAVGWRVQVKEGSNLIGVNHEPGFPPQVVNQIVSAVSQGLVQLEDRAAQPKYFSDRAVKSLRELAEIAGTSDTDNTYIRVWAKREPIRITHKSVANIADLIAGEHEDYGSIEGKLRAVTDKGGLHFVVHEPLRENAVRCYIPEHLLDVAMSNFRSRVEVYGRIKYRKDGRAISISVDDLTAFPSAEKIPSFRDVHGLLREAS